LSTDIAQEAFMKIWERRDQFKGNETIGLLYKISRDLMISQLRKEKVKQNYQSNLLILETVASPEEQLLYQELMDKYNQLLARMPEKQRTVFLLSRIDELKYSEIATRMGISTKAVEKRMTKALKSIRKELDAYEKH